MIISTIRFGRLGNRLLLLSHLIAYGCATGREVLDLGFWEYGQYFAATAPQSYWVMFPPHQRPWHGLPWPRLQRRINKELRRWLSHGSFIPRNWQIIPGWAPDVVLEDVVAPQAQVVLVRGWYVRSRNIGPYAPVVRQFFTPLPVYQRNIQQLITPLKDQYDVLVGVHIRLGDYREWRNGVYIYPLETWRALMAKMVDLLAFQRVGFLICSDEDLRPQAHHFQGLPVYYGTGHIIEDLYSLAACDYLLATPSTYSGWAAFYGQVPIYFLPVKDQVPQAIAHLTLSQLALPTEPYRTGSGGGNQGHADDVSTASQVTGTSPPTCGQTISDGVCAKKQPNGDKKD